MALLIHGVKRSTIDFGEFQVTCPSCHSHQWADVMVFSVYHHIYWIPIMPTAKEALVICQNCGLKRDGQTFDATLINNYVEIKSKFRHPFYAYIGVGVFILLMVTLVASLVADIRHP